MRRTRICVIKFKHQGVEVAKMLGADTEALDRLAHQFDNAADRLRNHAGHVSNGIQVAAWAGPVAIRFRADWDSTHSNSLKSAAEALTANAKSLRLNATEQRAASNSLEGDA